MLDVAKENIETAISRCWVRCLVALLLALLAVLGNAGHLPLFHGVDFIFGSIAVMFAVQLLGPIHVTLVAIAGGLYTVYLWGHPYALVTFTLEAIAVFWLYQRGWKFLVLADLVYWIFLGIPLVIIFYSFFIGFSFETAIFIALKQSMNALFNTLVGVLLFTFYRFVREGVSASYMPPQQLVGFLFNIFLAAILTVAGLPIIYQGHQLRDTEEKHLFEQMNNYLARLSANVEETFIENEKNQSGILNSIQVDQGFVLAIVGSEGDVHTNGYELYKVSESDRELSVLDNGLEHLTSKNIANGIQRWKEGVYRMETKFGASGIDRLIVEYPSKSIVLNIQSETSYLFKLLTLMMLLGVFISWLASKLLLTPLTRLSRVVSHTRNGVVITDERGYIEWINEGFTRISGYTLDEVKSKKPGQVLQGKDTDLVTVKFISNAISKKEKFEVDIVNYSKEGKPYWVHINSEPLLDKKGKVQGFMAIETDVTEIKKATSELNKIKETLDQTLDCVFMFDSDGLVFTYANAGAINQIGYSRDEIYTMHPFDIKPDVSKEEFYNLIDPLVKGERSSIYFETVHQHKDGHRIPVEIFLQYIVSDNNKNHFVAIVRDISERLSAQQQLYDEIQRTQAILDNMVDGLITIDEKGTIESCNPAVEAIFGYAFEEIEGKNIKMLMPNPHRDAHDGYLKKYRETGERHIIGVGREVEGLRKDGDVFPLELSVSEVNYHGHTLYVGMIKDITERKHLEKLKGEFISTVSHELRTPLTSIRGALNLALGKYGHLFEAKPRKMLEMAERNSERLTMLINDILDLEKIESGRMEFEFKPLDLVVMAQRSIEDNEGYAQNHKVNLVLTSDINNAFVKGDEYRLLQVLANLISNAVKFSPEGGIVELRLSDEGEQYRISVKDQGRGIPEEFRDRMFQRFAQADASDTREKGGTGLGLSITKAIVDRHLGVIDYESQLGLGTNFYIELHKYEGISNFKDNLEQSAAVLICEDDEDVAKVFHEQLLEEGISSDIALTLADARALLAEHQYKLLILDLSLPDGDGLGLLEGINLDSSLVDMKVIVVSGRADEISHTFKGDASNIVDWLQKPVDNERINLSVHKTLDAKMNPSILHVEDDEDIVFLVDGLLEETANLTHAASLLQAKALLASNDYDLVILDLELEDGLGTDLLDLIDDSCPILVFSAKEAATDIQGRISGTLTKSQTTNANLVKKIKQLLK